MPGPAAVDAGLVKPPAFGVATGAGVREVEYEPGLRPGWATASVDMGAAVLGPDQPQPSGGRRARRVDMGNPHLVLLGPDPSDVDVAELGPRLQEVHAGGVNVEFISVGPGADSLNLRVWERGVGETQACGTGSAAAVAAARSWGLVGERVAVHNPGGSLRVTLGADGVTLAGPTPEGGRRRRGPRCAPCVGAIDAVSPTQSAFTDTLISRTVRAADRPRWE